MRTDLPHGAAPPRDRRPGVRLALAHGHGARGRGDDPAALVRPARLDLGRRAQPPDRAHLPRRRLSAGHRAAAARAGPRVRVLGPRGVPAPGRGVAALRRPDAARAAAAGTATSARRTRTSPSEILAEIRARGPLGSRHFEGTSEGGMWNWKPAKAMLDRLWNHGDLVIAGRQGFQRLYDLPERVIPKEVLDAPVPGEAERLRALALKAVARPRRADRGGRRRALAAEGRRRAHPARRRRARRGRRCSSGVAVEDGGAPVLVPAGADLEPGGAVGRGAALAVRQPALGPAVRPPRARLRPPDRGLQEGARAPVRLLRAAAALARPHRRPRRPQVGARRGSARR